MTSRVPRRPQVVTCEDYDDATQTILKGTRRHANVGRKQSFDSDETGPGKSQDGSDSGYSSKTAPTEISNMSLPSKKATGLKVDTSTDRVSQPYAFVPVRKEAVATKPAAKVKPTLKIKSPKKERLPNKFVHEPGRCVTCDHFGYHFENPAITTPVSAAPLSSPKPKKKSSSKAKEAEAGAEARPTTVRRRSSIRDRPVTFYGGMPIAQATYGQPLFHYPQPQPVPIYAASPYPPTPVEIPQYYQQHQQPPPPPSLAQGPFYAASSPAVSSYSDHGGHFDHYMQQREAELSRAQKRISGQFLEPPFVGVPPPGPQPPPQRRPSHASQHRTEALTDAQRMPPPARPASKKASAEEVALPQRRRSVHYADEARPTTASRRLSRDVAPPTSYRPLGDERPPYGKSYSAGATTLHVANSTRKALPRRDTAPTATAPRASVEQQLQQVEAYLQKGSGDLTTDSLQDHMRKQYAQLATESGQRSQRSTKSRNRAVTEVSNSGCTTIDTGHGVVLSISEDMGDEPLDLRFGKVHLTMNQQKTLEDRAPSESSRTSRRSVDGSPLAQKSSNTSQPRNGTSGSKKSSRAPSISRAPVNPVRKNSRRGSTSYDERPESFYDM